ncbi:hypothetical protein MOQ19_10215 [Stenotrophomonas maltophilia]|nr:hypothetical protein [Stenotrophomonas maltophilia]
MAVFHVYDIVWETDGNTMPLPSGVRVTCDDMRHVADALSDAFGWLVADFKATVVSEMHQERV